MREGAAFLARYLLSCAALGQGTPGQGLNPATLLPLPSDASRQPTIQSPMFEGSLPLEGMRLAQRATNWLEAGVGACEHSCDKGALCPSAE